MAVKNEKELLGVKRVSELVLPRISNKSTPSRTKRGIKTENKENGKMIDTPRLKQEYIQKVKKESSSSSSLRKSKKAADMQPKLKKSKTFYVKTERNEIKFENLGMVSEKSNQMEEDDSCSGNENLKKIVKQEPK